VQTVKFLVMMQLEGLVIVRPWPKSIKDPESGVGEPPVFRCSYFMGLKKRPAAIYNSREKAAKSVNINTPVIEFKNHVSLVGILKPRGV